MTDEEILPEKENKEEGEPDESGDKDPETKTFTQEEVNEIVKKRLSKFYNRYGVEGKDELDTMVGKSQAYGVLEERYNTASEELRNTKQELMFIKNDIDTNKYSDVQAYFSGKGIELTPENLEDELANHNEWKKKVAEVKKMGSDAQKEQPGVDEKSMAARLFGFNHFVK